MKYLSSLAALFLTLGISALLCLPTAVACARLGQAASKRTRVVMMLDHPLISLHVELSYEKAIQKMRAHSAALKLRFMKREKSTMGRTKWECYFERTDAAIIVVLSPGRRVGPSLLNTAVTDGDMRSTTLEVIDPKFLESKSLKDTSDEIVKVLGWRYNTRSTGPRQRSRSRGQFLD